MTTPGPDKPPNTGAEEDGAMYKEVMEFQANLRAQPGDSERYGLCIEKRNDLLQQHSAVEMLIGAYERVMDAECKEYQQRKRRRQYSSENDKADQWDRFIGVAESGHEQIKNCLTALTQVSKCWGRDKIQHYEWSHRGPKYCKMLRAAANAVPNWEDASIKLSVLILRRMEMGGKGKRRIKDSRNPITQTDLENLGKWTDQRSYSKLKDPENVELLCKLPNELPNGYALDKFGLVVHRDFVRAHDEGHDRTNSNNRERSLESHQERNEGDGEESDGHESDDNEGEDRETEGRESDGHESDDNEGEDQETEGHESDDHESDDHESSDHESDNQETEGRESDDQEINNHESDNQETEDREGGDHNQKANDKGHFFVSGPPMLDNPNGNDSMAAYLTAPKRANMSGNSSQNTAVLRPRYELPKYGGKSLQRSRIAKSTKRKCCAKVPFHITALLDKHSDYEAAGSKDCIQSVLQHSNALCRTHLKNLLTLISRLAFPRTHSTPPRGRSPANSTSTRRRTASDASLDSDTFSHQPKRSKFRETPSHDLGFAENFQHQTLEDIKQTLSLLPKHSHGWHHNNLVHTLLNKAMPANIGTEVHFLSGEQAAEMLESANDNHPYAPIVTQSQQLFRWDEFKRPIQQLFERMIGLQHNVSVNIPSRDGGCVDMTLTDVRERFLANNETTNPWNIPDLHSPLPSCILPAFLMGENCQLLSRIRDVFLMSDRGDRALMPWKAWKNVEGFAVLSEGGHNTEPHMDSHGYATWLTVQEGDVGFGWMSDPTPDELEGWMSNPQNYSLGRWKYVVLRPGQSIFFDSGTIRFVFRAQKGQSLMLGGHILRWTNIVHWTKTVAAQKQTDMFNKKVVSTAAEYVEVLNTLVSHQFKSKIVDVETVKMFKRLILRGGPNKSPLVVVDNPAQDQLMIKYHDITLRRESLGRLRRETDNGYLDDDLVVFYLWFLRDQLAHQQAPDCPVIEPLIIPLIMAHGTAVLQDRSPIDIFTPDFTIVPMFYDNGQYQHWYLAILCHLDSLLEDKNDGPTPRFLLLDSLFQKRTEGEEALKELVTFEAKRQDKSVKMERLHITSPEALESIIPGQPAGNDYDCGLYILIYCEMFLLDPPDFIRKFVVGKTPFNKNEWGNLQSNRVRQRYGALIQRFTESRRCDGKLIDGKNDAIIDGVLGPMGRGLMRAYQHVSSFNIQAILILVSPALHAASIYMILSCLVRIQACGTLGMHEMGEKIIITAYEPRCTKQEGPDTISSVSAEIMCWQDPGGSRENMGEGENGMVCGEVCGEKRWRANG